MFQKKSKTEKTWYLDLILRVCVLYSFPLSFCLASVVGFCDLVVCEF